MMPFFRARLQYATAASRTPLTYLIGVPEGAWIWRQLIASSVETAENHLVTGDQH